MPSWTPTTKDFSAIAAWNLNENPFAALEDFSEMKKELRWLNPEHREAFVDYIHKRLQYIEFSKNFDDYYRKANKPIDRDRWEYLMKRKAWYVMPLGWENIAKTGGAVVDLGCGDGDTVQRLIDFTEQYWEKNGIRGKRLHITGIDLNASRIVNAQELVRSKNSAITTEFEVGDAVGAGLRFTDCQFDYALCTGVLEILEDEPNRKFMDEMCRVTKTGLYIEDLAERFPGGYPRLNLPELLAQRKFSTKKHHYVLTEPFDVAKLRDPIKLWPMLLDQNLWAERK